jgi:hypothetical protein
VSRRFRRQIVDQSFDIEPVGARAERERHAVHERGTRERGHVVDPMHVFQVLESELDAFLADPGSFTEILASRHAEWLTLAELEPPRREGR